MIHSTFRATRLFRSLLALFVIISIVTLSCSSQNTDKNDSQSQEKTEMTGSDIYHKYCVNCHGEKGNLGLSGAKDLSVSVKSKAEITQQVTDGKGLMMSFSEKLSADQISKVADYVLTLRK